MRVPRLLFLVGGPLLGAIVFAITPETIARGDGTLLTLGVGGKVAGGMTAWMAVWWVSEALPLYLTALLPLVILPLSGVMSMNDASTPYGHRVVFIALGGFVLAAALEKWHLHRRFARFVIGICGTGPRRIVGGFMVASATLSMWISNVATAIIMLPVALSVVALVDKDNPHADDFSVCLLLSICYSCSIGGMGTLIGTGTNMFFAGYMENTLNRPVSFAHWMSIALPIVFVFLPLAWLLLTRVIFRIPSSADELKISGATAISQEPWNRGAVLALTVFALCAMGWTFLPLLRTIPPLANLTDTGVAVIAMLVLFVIPADQTSDNMLMDWQTAASKVPWGVLLLIGGGLAMADAVSRFGVAELLAALMGDMGMLTPMLLIFAVVAMMVFLTEVSSNFATVAALTPLFAAIALARGMDPTSLVIPITIAASCAFMLPAATLTNSIIMGSGQVHGWQMARAGVVLNVVAIVVISTWFGVALSTS